MKNEEYEDSYEEGYEDDCEEEDCDDDCEEEEGRNYDPPTPVEDRIGMIQELKSKGEVQDLVDALDEHLQLASVRREAGEKSKKLEYLRMADRAPRCEHMKPNGERCGSPAVKGESYCFFHHLGRKNAWEFPVIEDKRGYQVAVMHLCERLAKGTISAHTGKVLLQALSLAAENADSLEWEESHPRS